MVGLVFGGASGEHEVSIRSAATVERGLASGANAQRYQLQRFYIDRNGYWWGEAIAREASSFSARVSLTASTVGFVLFSLMVFSVLFYNRIL